LGGDGGKDAAPEWLAHAFDIWRIIFKPKSFVKTASAAIAEMHDGLLRINLKGDFSPQRSSATLGLDLGREYPMLQP
jgi:hypothetical protein